MKHMLKCCICGTEYEGEYDDECPKCFWANSGIEEQLYNDDEIDAFNGISRAEAKKNYAKGFDYIGNPINK